MPLVFFALACADLTDEVTPTDAALLQPDGKSFRGELLDYDLEEDGLLVVQLVEEIRGRPPTYGAVHAQVSVNADGTFSVLPPEVPEDVTFVQYRVVIREALEGGVPGPIREFWPGALVWHYDLTPGGAPAGWSVETHNRGVAAWSPLGVAPMTLDFRPLETITLGGTFSVTGVTPDDGTTVGVALMAGDEVVPGAVGAVDGVMWGLRLDGRPDTGSAFLQPVAYIDADGVLGFDPETETVVAKACARDTDAFVQWIDEPYDVSVAAHILFRAQNVGWNALTTLSTPTGRNVPPGAVRMAESCS